MTSMYSAERERETSVCENESGNSGWLLWTCEMESQNHPPT
jgi:hypothetical protein